MVGERETGNETYTVNLLRALAADSVGDFYQVLSTFPKRLAAMVELPPPFEIVRIWPRSSILRIPFAMPATVWRKKSDILHVSYIAPLWVPCRTVVTVHDLSFLVYPQSVSVRTRFVLTTLVPVSVRRAARVIAVSEHTKKDLIDRYGLLPHKIIVIHEAASSAFGRLPQPDRFPLPKGVIEPFILAVGNLEPRKNLARLVQAFASLVGEGRFSGQLVLAGKPKAHAKEIVRLVRRSGLESRVLFTGFVTEGELKLLYNRAALLAYPSLYEGFGLPPIEAMACGCPVVASNASALPETLGDAAILVSPTSTEALTGAMRAVLERDDLRRDLREKGLRHAATYSWEKVAQRTRAVYTEALTASPSPVTA